MKDTALMEGWWMVDGFFASWVEFCHLFRSAVPIWADTWTGHWATLWTRIQQHSTNFYMWKQQHKHKHKPHTHTRSHLHIQQHQSKGKWLRNNCNTPIQMKSKAKCIESDESMPTCCKCVFKVSYLSWRNMCMHGP